MLTPSIRLSRIMTVLVGHRPAPGLQCLHRGDDLLAEGGEPVRRVVGGPCQDESTEIPLDERYLHTKHSMACPDYRFGRRERFTLGDRGQALQPFPSPLGCQRGDQDSGDSLVGAQSGCTATTRPLYRDSMLVSEVDDERTADATATTDLAQRAAMGDVLVAQPLRIHCVFASPLPPNRDSVVACEFGDRRFADADHCPDFSEASTFGLVEIMEPLRCEKRTRLLVCRSWPSDGHRRCRGLARITRRWVFLAGLTEDVGGDCEAVAGFRSPKAGRVCAG